jgi:hypothetical protein
MADLVEILKNVGKAKDNFLLNVRNANSPRGPGQGAPAPGESPIGPVRYSKDGSPPTPVNFDGSVRNVDNSGLTKEKFP